MKEKYKIAIGEFTPYLIIFGIIGLTAWLQALIIPDMITQLQAQIVGYIILGVIIFLGICALFYEKIRDVETRQLIDKNEELDKKIEQLEKELERAKRD